jgi:hypothetical protein
MSRPRRSASRRGRDHSSTLSQPPAEQGGTQHSSRSRQSEQQNGRLNLPVPGHVIDGWSTGDPDCVWELVREASDIIRRDAEWRMPPPGCQCLTCLRVQKDVDKRRRRGLREREHIGEDERDIPFSMYPHLRR